MEKDELKKLLPHREPMLLLDSSEIINSNTARGCYIVKGNEFFLQGHFPGEPIVPGVILCEIMAQNCALILKYFLKSINSIPLLTTINKAKFKGVAKPKDELDIKSTIKRQLGEFFLANGEIFVKDKLISKAEFSFWVKK